MPKSRLKYLFRDRVLVELWSDYNDWSVGFSVGYLRQDGESQRGFWFHLELGPYCFTLALLGT